MITCSADYISACIGKNYAGHVMQVFNEAINVLGDGPLWIIGPSRGPQPLGITLSFLPNSRKGDSVLKDGNTVTLDENYKIDLTDAKVWSTSDLALSHVNLNLYNEIVFWSRRHILSPGYIDALINGEHLLYSLDQFVIDRLRGLVFDAVNGFGFEKAGGLIGLGSGLTPAGDDALVGMLASLKGSDHFIRLAKIIKGSLKKTNWVSQGYLECAAIGEFGIEVANFIRACEHKNNLELSIKAISQVGHSSGTFFMLGFIGGLRIRIFADSPSR